MTTRTSFAALVTVFFLMAGTCWSAVPQSLSYQGYLTDRIGSPITDSQTITFSIYTAPVDGVPVWQETKSVAFANGLFSVRLGELTAFPPDLFDVPLWLGMTIGTDSEMEPRRPLTTAGFSFRAEDADGLQGRSAAELDQSLHVDDDANPHIVTAVQTGAATAVALDAHATDGGNPHGVAAAQTGAATQAGLDAHATDGGNPHGVTAGQTGGTPAGTFTAHAADGAAHHTRYADAEAVIAMGVQDGSNPLNHARYTDSAAVAAVLAADGDGSGLDADSVDGLDAQQLMDVAAGGVRVMSGSDEIGLLMSGGGLNANGFTALTTAGYEVKGVFNSVSFAVEPLVDLYYLTDDCTGQTYVRAGTLGNTGLFYEFTARQGRIYTARSGPDRHNFYVPKNSTLTQNIVSASQAQSFDGLCQVADEVIGGYEVFENDPAVTGFLNTPDTGDLPAYTGPVTFVR